MTGRIEKTVFISYRRANKPWALFIYQNLTNHGYDVFIDFQNINSGNFETAILANIRARAHFVVVLTPSALENCKNQGDWLRREIETAMDEKRNIVPLMVDGFDFGSPLVKNALTGKLSALSTINGLRIPDDFPFEAMDRLRERYLNVDLKDVTLPALQEAAQEISDAEQSAANEAAPVKEEQLTAQTWFERGYVLARDKNFDEAVRCYTEAIHLEPEFAEAYNNRGAIYGRDKRDMRIAIQDFNVAIRLKSDYADAYSNRGNVRRANNDLQGAMEDHTEAIRLKPDYAEAYYNRGNARKASHDLQGALADYTEAIRFKPDYAEAYNNRGNVRTANHDLQGAMADYTEAIRFKPDYAEAYNNRGNARDDSHDLQGALADYNEAIRLKPDYVNAYYNRASLWEKDKDYLLAVTDYQKYLELGGGGQDSDQKEIEDKIKILKSKLTRKKSVKKKSK